MVNTDGAKTGGNTYGCGGIIRDMRGKWIYGFAKGLGACSVQVAELWGAMEGLKLAWDRGFRRVELQLDAKGVVNMLNKEVSSICRLEFMQENLEAFRA
jgi:ribonuclease HI